MIFCQLYTQPNQQLSVRIKKKNSDIQGLKCTPQEAAGRYDTQEMGDATQDKENVHDDEGNPQDDNAAGLEQQVRLEQDRGLREGISGVGGFKEAIINCNKK